MSYEDKTIVCDDCGQEFVHSAEDQVRYAERGFQDPKRCRECRDKRKSQQASSQQRGGGGQRGSAGGGRPPRRGGRGGGRGGWNRRASGQESSRQSYEVNCSACGVATTVPFEPVEGRPVYCRECYRSLRREK